MSPSGYCLISSNAARSSATDWRHSSMRTQKRSQQSPTVPIWPTPTGISRPSLRISSG